MIWIYAKILNQSLKVHCYNINDDDDGKFQTSFVFQMPLEFNPFICLACKRDIVPLKVGNTNDS